MRIKKKIAGILAGTMLLSSMKVLGNVQERLPLNGIAPIVVTHTLNVSTGDIVPSAQVSFNKAPTNKDTSGVYTAEAEYYQFVLKDALGSEPAFNKIKAVENKEIYTEKIENYLKNINEFKNGALYRLTIKPGHTHTDSRGNQTEASLSNGSADPVKFFLTDFNTQMKEEKDELVVSWEYVPGATYKLVYIPKAVGTKEGVDGTDGDNQAGVSSRQVEITEDNMQTFTEKGVKKVKYTIPNTKPGQKYSAYVVVTNIVSNFLTDKFENVGMNTSHPKIVQAARSVMLNVYNIGRNRIELSWELGSWANDNSLIKTKIYRKTEGETSFTLIGTLDNKYMNPRDPGKFQHDEPKLRSTYYIEFIFTGLIGEESLLTKEVEYVPYELREQPLKPQIPMPYAPSLQQEEGFNKSDYLVSEDNVDADKMKDHTFHANGKQPVEVQIVWDAPKKVDGTIEHEMAYDIWVTEDKEMLEDTALEPIISDLVINSWNQEGLIYKKDNQTIVGFKTLFSQYISKSGVKENLLSNKTYYIKMVAKRKYGAEYSISQGTIVAITINKNGDIFEPPILSKPPLKIKDKGITQNSITLEWLEKWYEITAKDPSRYKEENDERFLASSWNSKVYTGGSPEIQFVEKEGLTSHLLLTQNALDNVKKLVGLPTYNANYADRKITLGSDVNYEVKTLLYDEVVQLLKAENEKNPSAQPLTLERWVVDYESDTTEGWRTITPSKTEYDDQLDWKTYTIDALKANTRYIVLMRVYRTLDTGEKLMQTYPSYVIGTTATDYKEPEAIPTIPDFNPNGVSEDSVSVWWTYNEDFEYEVVYSRLNNPETAIKWPVTFSNTPGEPNYVSNGAKVVATITGLAANTTYNVWIRAKQKTGDQVSNWSNPVTQTTDSIEVPDAPRGLGPAAYQSIVGVGLDFPPVNSTYLTVEWLKDVEDKEAELSKNKMYTYIVEFADNAGFLDAITVDTSEPNAEGIEILDKTLVRFTGLEANSPYYVRVKTRLTYVNPETGETLVKESNFTTYVRIFTKVSNTEYDGGEDENVVIYPNAVEETYQNGIWTYEIVDTAKIITYIQTQKQYFYTIKLENYKNQYDATIRRIKMPKKVLDTLMNQSMALKIVTNKGIYEIPGKALQSYASAYSAKDIVQFNLTQMSYLDILGYARSYPEYYVGGEKLEITVKNTPVQKLQTYMTVKLKQSSISLSGAYLTPYQYQYTLGNWQKYAYTLDPQDNRYISYSTAYTGLNALYETLMTAESSKTSYGMNELAQAYQIGGLGTSYTKTQSVGASEYVNLLLGIQLGRTSIQLSTQPTASDYAKAKAAGLYVSNNRGALTQEQALAGVVKLYEITHGYPIKASNKVFNKVSANYKQAASKAYAIGLIETMETPQSTLNYEMLCDWVIQVVQ